MNSPGDVGHATVGVTVYNLTSHIYELPPRYPYGAHSHTSATHMQNTNPIKSKTMSLTGQ